MKTAFETYMDLKAKHKDAIILMRCGDFYETYNADAKACADVLGVQLTWKDDFVIAGFPAYRLTEYLPRLIRAGRRVAICDQEEVPKQKTIQDVVSQSKSNENDNEESCASQCAKIRAWLESGHTITSLEALKLFGCLRLSSRIWDLRNDGVNVQKERIKTASGKFVAQYSIAQ